MTPDLAELKLLLDVLATKYNQQEFIVDDPIQIPHRFKTKEDIEISGFLTALLAWGNRPAIIRAATLLMECMDNAPYQFVMQHDPSDLNRFNAFVYRTMQPNDLKFLVSALANIYQNHGGLELLFTSHLPANVTDVFGAISKLREVILQTPHAMRAEKHVANPETGSAAKRINLFLRWMVRQDDLGVDFGFWKGIRPNQLICPLDVHSGKSARALGLITRKANDRIAAEDLTRTLKTLDPLDPVKYDFALFGLGKDGLING